jgi:hypothetical protein
MAAQYGDDADIGGTLDVDGSTTLGDAAADTITVTGQLTGSQGASFSDRVGIGTATPTTTLHAYASVSDAYVTLIDNDAASNAHGLKVTSDGTGTGTILLDVEAASTTVFKIRGDGRVGIGVATPGSTLSVDDEIAVGEKLVHRGDPDTYLQFPGQNQMNLAANGYAFLTYDGNIKINVDARDRDTQILADDGNVVIHVDAGDNRVGIGTASPACLLHVDGAAQVTTLKHNDSTFGGMTRVTSGVSSVTMPVPNNTSAYVDTTINIPAYSITRYIFLKKSTVGANSSGAYWVSNIAEAHSSESPDSNYDEFSGDWGYPGHGSVENGYNLEGSVTYVDESDTGTGHWVINGMTADSGKIVPDFARDLYLKISTNGGTPGTAAVLGIFVVYDTFDVS